MRMVNYREGIEFERQQERYASRVAKLLGVFIEAILLAVFILTFPWSLPSITQKWSPYIFPLCTLVVLVLSFLNIGWGITIMAVVRTIERRLTNRFLKWLMEISGREDNRS